MAPYGPIGSFAKVVPDLACQPLTKLAGGERRDDRASVCFRPTEVNAVQATNGVECKKQRSLISARAWMIAGNGEGMGRRQFANAALSMDICCLADPAQQHAVSRQAGFLFVLGSRQ